MDSSAAECIFHYNRWIKTRVALIEGGVYTSNSIVKDVSFLDRNKNLVLLQMGLVHPFKHVDNPVGSVVLNKISPTTVVSEKLKISERYRGFGLSKLLFRLEQELVSVLYGSNRRLLAFVRNDNVVQCGRLRSLGWKLVDRLRVEMVDSNDDFYSDMWAYHCLYYPPDSYIDRYEIDKRLDGLSHEKT